MKELNFLLTLISVGLVASANPVTEQQALKRAQAFVNRHAPTAVISQQSSAASARRVQSNTAPAYYVFNIDNAKGYVIASGSDKAVPVLAYVDNGSFDENNIPPAMQEYLEVYAEQIDWAEANNIPVNSSARVEGRNDVDVLLTTKWDQGSPYQTFLNIRGETIWSPTGCLTTATAQVMNYHKWPAGTTQVIPSYSLTSTISTPELEPVTFDWGNMKDTYSSSDKGTVEGDAVATLMQYVALAEQANLGMTSTSTVDSHAAYALKVYFDYDDGVRFLQDWNLTPTEWEDVIYNELANSRPVIHTGTRFNGNSSPGHAFVCDGYRAEDGMFHFNWGWSGSSDGWFALDALQPSSVGTGGGSGTGGYNYLRGIVVGVQKPDGIPAEEVNEVVDQLAMVLESEPVMHRESRDQDAGEIRVGIVMYPFDFQNLWYECALGLYNEAGELVRVYPFEVKNYMKGYTYPNLVSVPIGADLPLGKYELKTVSRLLDSDVYRSAIGADHRRFRIDVQEQLVTVTPSYDLTVSNVSLGETTSSSYKNVIYDLTNNSDEDFVGRIYVTYTSGTSNKTNSSYQVFVPAGETTHIEPYSGTTGLNASMSNVFIGFDARHRWTLWCGNDNYANVDYQLQWDHHADSQGNLVGNDYEFTVHLTNRGEVTYDKDVTAILYESSGSYLDGITQVQHATIDAKHDQKLKFKFSDLPEGKTYSLRVTHYEATANANVTYGTATDGLRFTTGKGTYIRSVESDSCVVDGAAVTVPEDALWVDARNSEALDGITPNENPNTLYLLAEGTTVPQNLAGKNVVVGNVAQSITLSDDYSFETPIDFTAASIVYKRNFGRNGDGKNNWETISLPFEVTGVKVGGNDINWVKTSGDNDSPMWVMEITGQPTGDVLTLDYAQAMQAYKPYLIAVRDLAGQEIEFSGSNATLTAEQKGVAVNGNYDLIGHSAAQLTNYVYLLDEPSNMATEAGTSSESSLNKFTLSTDKVNIAPFRAYVVNYSQSTPYGQLTLDVPYESLTGVSTVVASEPVMSMQGIYTLDGRKIANDGKSLSSLPLGIYIMNGKKVVR